MPTFRMGNQDIEGDYVSYTPLKEEWNEYLVGDYIVRMKVVVSSVFKAKDTTDPQGNPVFYVQSGPVMSIRKNE